jgi:hypothetical protein
MIKANHLQGDLFESKKTVAKHQDRARLIAMLRQLLNEALTVPQTPPVQQNGQEVNNE